jgi:DEAD/DEAH box helicase domain-containing protein
MERDIVYFDLETQRSSQDVGGWDKKRDMGVSVAVTYSTAAGAYRIYREKEMDALVDQLRRAHMVVGYNLINFDYEVLQKYTVLDLASVVPTLDLLVEIEKRLKSRVPLDAVASASLGVGKTADGLQAITWWRQGKILEIAEYCCFDVKCTKLVHEFGIQHKKIFYENRSRQRCELAVDWP